MEQSEKQIEEHIEKIYIKSLKKYRNLGWLEIKETIEMTPGALLNLYKEGFFSDQFEDIRLVLENFLCKVDKRDNFQYSLAIMYTLN
jgi:hypothetical protein